MWKERRMFRNVGRTILVLLVLVGFTVHAAQAQQVTLTKVDLNGTYYQERFGNSDDLAADTIRTPPGYDANPPSGQPGYAPGCFLKGVTITADYTIQNNTGRPLGVMIGVGLTNSDDGSTYWTRQYGIPNLLPYPDVHSITLPALPDHIANLNLGFTFTFMVQDMYGAWQPAGQQVLQPIRLHTVLDQPQSPMDRPRDPVLEIACRWANRESAKENAMDKLTDELYNRGTYNGGNPAYTSNETDSGGETFHLKSFLEGAPGRPFPWGQCNDFADFLVCLINSVGAYFTKAQRTNSLSGPGFFVKPLVPAGGGPSPSFWTYHQFALFNIYVWDGCISITGFGVPKGWSRDTDYQSRLVDHYETGGAWNPLPGGGFTPTVTTAPPP